MHNDFKSICHFLRDWPLNVNYNIIKGIRSYPIAQQTNSNMPKSYFFPSCVSEYPFIPGKKMAL